MNHTFTNCQAADCGRLHQGDVVRVVYGGPTQVGFMQLGEVVAQPTADGYTVHFADGAAAMDRDGNVLDTITEDLTYGEHELELVTGADEVWEDQGVRVSVQSDVEARSNAIVAVAKDILADPEWTQKVVVAAIVAQDNVQRDTAAWNVLDGALSPKKAAF